MYVTIIGTKLTNFYLENYEVNKDTVLVGSGLLDKSWLSKWYLKPRYLDLRTFKFLMFFIDLEITKFNNYQIVAINYTN